MWRNKDFVDNTIKSFLDYSKNRKLILFGAGEDAIYAFDDIIMPNNMKPAYFVDNDFRKWYSRLYSINIYEPSYLLNEQSDSSIILITSRFPYNIAGQLDEMGVQNYYSNLLFLERHLGKQSITLIFNV